MKLPGNLTKLIRAKFWCFEKSEKQVERLFDTSHSISEKLIVIPPGFILGGHFFKCPPPWVILGFLECGGAQKISSGGTQNLWKK